MKKLLTILFSVFILFMFTDISFAQNKGQGQGRGYGQGNKTYNGVNERDRREHHMYQQNYGRDRDDYRGRQGYNSNHGNYHYNHHYDNYTYHGHWNNRDDWDRYYMRHPEFRNHGHYNMMNGMLFFMFNDGVNSFGFSIGN